MFNSELTKNYNHQDATLEILLMLAGAFLLGCLLCWLIRNFFTQKNNHVEPEQLSSYKDTQNDVHVAKNTFPNTQVPKIKKSVNYAYNTPRMDDLTKISGIDNEMQNRLKKSGVRSYIDLRDIEHDKLKEIIGADINKTTGLREIETWPHQASLAAKGEWTRLYDYQSFVQRAKAASQKNTRPKNADDLKKIEGIGPKIEEILNRKGIYTFKQLRKTESDTLKRFIVIEDIRFEKNETESWPHQAGMAEKGQWEELSIYQEFMEYSENDDDDPLESLEDTASKNVSNIKELEIVSGVVKQDENIEDNISKKEKELNRGVSPKSKDYLKLLDNETENFKKDDLKKIDGIGPKIESVLNRNGIYTFKDLHKTDRNTLKSYLDNAGPQFKIHEPASWPHQAGMAARDEWNDLRTYQEFMDNGRGTPLETNITNSPSLHIKNVTTKDDLKKIEGIGPKIENLLQEAGIDTFEKLKNSDRDTIKAILDAAGPQYRMHEPETWPLQASMAFKGEWEKLEEYQDFLLGGRE